MNSTRSEDIFIVAAKRTAFGAFGGALKGLSATDLGVEAAKAAIAQAEMAPDAIDQVIFGNVQQTSADAIYHARHVGLRAGVPIERPALNVNRLCGSGFQAVLSGAEQIRLGEASVVLVGGAENMTQAPHVVRGARAGFGFGQSPGLEDSLWTALTDSFCGAPMGMTAENLAERYGIDRETCDAYALSSQRRWKEAQAGGHFRAEIAPVDLPSRRGSVRFEVDEHPRPETDSASLAKLKPVFKKDGVVTAGNASGLADGAAALLIASGQAVRTHRLRPLARLVQWAVVGVDPSIMGIGPAPAIRSALDRAGLQDRDIDLYEVNEAFAPQYLAVEKELGLDRARTNVNGGAIALGHPLGASGARITAHLVYELGRRGKKRAVGSACIGGGQGIALVIEAA